VWAASTKAAAVITFGRRVGTLRGLDSILLYDPKAPETPAQLARREARGNMPLILVRAPEITKLYDASPVGPIPAKLSTSLAPPVRKPAKLRNVAGLLRGSDPALKETCVMVTAHYDHVGMRGPEGTDRIFNGANDDGSGTVSVIEIASALATLKERPKRSILFVTFFGEEKGLLGSRYYGKHPIVPVDKTIADVNLEQVGRTDDSEGPRVGSAVLTGFGYSDVSKVFVASGEAEGMQVVKHPRNSDLYFGRSDNQALADLGVPAHTLCVAFSYSDYHGAADHWDKVDYANMAKVDRLVARTLLTIADDPEEPKWDESNPRAAKYLKAWKDRREK
jgi:Zn-dependent M28 family amino/carboxypeptidase